MDKELNLLVNELYKIIAGIKECRRFNRLEPIGNNARSLIKLNEIVHNIQHNQYESSIYDYCQIETLVEMLQSVEWVTSGMWPSILMAITNILKRPASHNIVDRSFCTLLEIDIVSYENKLEGITSQYLSCLVQILLGESSSSIKADSICQAYIKLFYLSLQNKHSTVRLHSLNTFTLLLTRHHIQDYQLPLILSVISSLDWLTAIKNEPGEKRLHITSIDTLESLEINKFDYYNVLKLYSTNVSILANIFRNNMPSIPSLTFMDRLSSLVLSTLNSINEYLELFIEVIGNGEKNIKQSLKYVLKNHLSFSLFISFLWENEGIIEASIRGMFNLYKIFGMDMSKHLELLLSQLFSNPLNANKEYNAYLLRRIFLSLSARDIYSNMDAFPYRHNTYQALVKLLLANSIPEIKEDRSVNNINKRKNVFSQTRTKTRERSARVDEPGIVVEMFSTDSLSHTLSAISALLSAFFMDKHISDGENLKNEVNAPDLVDKFNNNEEWLKYFDKDEKKIVQFLKSPFLDLKRVGEFLGSHSNPMFMDKVRREFVAQFNFTAVPIVTALRIFLSTFRLPGESQQIERIIDSFAEAYYSDQLQQANPTAGLCDVEDTTPTHNENNLTLHKWIVQEEVYFDTFKDEGFLSALRAFYDSLPNLETDVIPNKTMIACIDVVGPYVWRKSFETSLGAWFANADAVFVLCYSIIMLNTDLHNSQIKNKMKLEEFIRNNKGINAGGDLPDQFLNDIYNSISRSQIQLYKDYAGSIQPTRDSFNTNYARKTDFLQLPLVQYRQFWNKVNDAEFKIFDLDREIHTSESTKSCIDILIKSGILDFLDAAIYLSSSAEFLQDTLTVLWKLSLIAERIGAIDLVNEIFILPSLAFTDQLSHRCQILIAFTLHYIAAFGRLFDSRSWEIAYSAILSLLSLNLMQNSPFGMPGPAVPTGAAIIPPKVKFHRVDLKRQGFKWISDIAGYIFSNKHTATESASIDDFTTPRFGKEALESASPHFLFSPQNKDNFISTPLFDPLLSPSQIELIKSDEDEQSLRHLFDIFYQFGPANTSANKSRSVDYAQKPIAAMFNLSTLPDTSIPQLLDYYKFRLALINHYKAHLLIPAALASSNCKMSQFDSGLVELERCLFGQKSNQPGQNTKSSVRRFEREEEESERCKRGVIVAPNEKEISRFRIKASPLMAFASLGMIMDFIYKGDESNLGLEKLEKTMDLFSKTTSVFNHELIDSENPEVIDSDLSALNWLVGDELDSVKVSMVAIMLDVVANLIDSSNAKLSSFCNEILHLISRLPSKYLSPFWLKLSIHRAISVAANSSGFLPCLLLIQRICGLGEITITHRHDKRSCVTDEHSIWRIFLRLIANSGISNGECKEHLAEVVQTIILIAIFYQKCPLEGEEDHSNQIEAVKLLVSLKEGGVIGRCLAMRSLALISSFAPKAVRSVAMVNLQQYLSDTQVSLNEFFSTLNGVVIPLVTYKWTYKDLFIINEEDSKLPLFHQSLEAALSVTELLTEDVIAGRMASSFSTLCQTFMGGLPLLLQSRDSPPVSIDSSIDELTKCGDNCIGYLLLAIRMVLRSLAEPAAKILGGKDEETFTEAIKNLIFVIVYTDEIKKAPETCVKHAHGYHLLDSCAEAAGVADKVVEARPSDRAVLATIANSISDAQDLQDIFVGIIQTIYA